MKKPNFFIIGAPKCGTTSLAAWLSEHSNIYFSPVKEPSFFDTDRKFVGRFSWAEYDRMFQEAGPDHLAIGEGSTAYLRSGVAVKSILSYADNPKFIVCFRDPVEMAISLHGQLLRMGIETEKDFEKAWHLQEKRAGGKGLPFMSQNEGLDSLQYRDICSLGSQMACLYRTVPRASVRVLLLEDIQQNPRDQYLSVLDFLGVPDDGRQRFPVYNAAEQLPVGFARLMMMATQFKRLLRLRRSFGLLRPFKDRLERPGGKSPVSDSFRLELARTFRDDVLLLQNLIHRDLSNWQPLRLDGVVR